MATHGVLDGRIYLDLDLVNVGRVCYVSQVLSGMDKDTGGPEPEDHQW